MKNILGLSLILAIASSAAAQEYFKYTDQNGIVYWLDDKNKIPPPIPTQHKYEDKNGITFWVDDSSKIPDEYKIKVNHDKEASDTLKPGTDTVTKEKKQYATRISIVENQIIVPVVFRNKGRRVKAKMILDTGASVTTLYSALASRLNLKNNKLSMVRSMNANGVISDSALTKVDHIEVDDKIVANAEVIVIPSHTNIGVDGLLGNSFLKFFNFTIDYDNQLLRWN